MSGCKNQPPKEFSLKELICSRKHFLLYLFQQHFLPNPIKLMSVGFLVDRGSFSDQPRVLFKPADIGPFFYFFGPTLNLINFRAPVCDDFYYGTPITFQEKWRPFPFLSVNYPYLVFTCIQGVSQNYRDIDKNAFKSSREKTINPVIVTGHL